MGILPNRSIGPQGASACEVYGIDYETARVRKFGPRDAPGEGLPYWTRNTVLALDQWRSSW